MKSLKVETRTPVLREALMRRVHRRMHGSGSLSLPAAPSLLDAYSEMLATQFRMLGRPFSPDELAHLRKILTEKLDEAWRVSPHGYVDVSWSTDASPAVSISYSIAARTSTTDEEYAEWVRTREPPLFGEHPDAKVVDVALSLGEPASVPCLDIGAGTGRNTVPLAARGFPVDAVEKAPALLALLGKNIWDAQVPAKVLAGDVLGELSLPAGKYALVFLCEVVSSFRTAAQVRTLFERVSAALRPGGVLLFSAFIAHDAYPPERLAREVSDVFWSTIFTRKQIAEALAGLPLQRVSDESVHDYEKSRQPAEAWPPTGWFTEWSQGLDIFALEPGRSPVDLRWLVYRRT